LCALIWPWLGGCLQSVQESAGQHPTAVHFLHFLDTLRSIILQDAAAMFLLLRNEEPSEQRRLKHSVFGLPVFHSDLFGEFVDEMETVLANEAANNPNDIAIDRALPGVNRRFDEVVTMLREIHGDKEETATEWKKQGDKIETLQQTLLEQEGRAVKRHRETAQTIAGFLQHSAEYIQQAVSEEPEESEGAVHQFHHHEGTQQSPGASCDDDSDLHEEDEVEELTRVMGYQPSFRRKNLKAIDLMDIYNEYYGLGEFEGVPITGGVYGLEIKYKNGWRGVYSAADNIFFSRLKSMMASLAVHGGGEEEGVESEQLRDKAAEWQPLLRLGGLAGCHKKLQGLGLISKKGSRVRSAAAGS
jgi:hypothetical protein